MAVVSESKFATSETPRFRSAPLTSLEMIVRGRFLFSCLLAALVSFPLCAEGQQLSKPRVFITTDINDGKGDPDDRQSLCHLLLYGNEVAIEGIVPDRFKPSALRACNLAIDLYEQDFLDPNTRFQELGYPSPESIRGKVFADSQIASEKLVEAALAAPMNQPLYVLAWGNL